MAGPPERAPGAQLVALLSAQGKFLVGEPFFGRPGGGSRERIVVERSRDAAPGRLVLLQPRSRGRAQVLKVLGKPNVARDVVEALMYDRGLQRRFPPGVERAAADAAQAVAADDPAGDARVDLRDLPTFTVDPATAKDFDDAISAAPLDGDRVRVWVHIADVSAYVRPGSAVDREAYRRGTSVYVPGAVEPMLPEALSNGACSLVPGEDRRAVTAILDYEGADVVRVAFRRTLIRSDARLTYEDVDAVFAGERPAEAPWAEPLALARSVSAALQERREAGGAALAIESTEPEFRFDRRGHVANVAASVQTESHRLIEHLMIGANEQVAKLLSERKVPALYRVHERPDGERAERLVAQLASLGVATPPVAAQLSSTEAALVIAECSRAVDEHVRRTGRGRTGLTTLVLRALQQARYDPAPLGHAGLGLQHYCHFTSPIRRYPDLVCHRALLSAIGAGEEAPRAATMEESGTQLSVRERDAMVIERDADDVVRCFVLERELFQRGWDTPWDGEVTGVIGAGAFVAFGDAGTDGMLPVRRLRGDWYELNEEGTILHGERTGTTIRIGDPVRVRVGRVDVPRGRVDLDPVEEEGEEAPAPARAPAPAPREERGGDRRPRVNRDPERRDPPGAGREERRAGRPRREASAEKPAAGDAPRKRKPGDPDWEPAKPKVRKGRRSKARAKAAASEAARKEARAAEKRARKRAKRGKKPR